VAGADGHRPARRASRVAGPARYPGKIRIIGGAWRGRRLPVPHSSGLRPTPDVVRETLFNWLAPYIEGSRCLDLFAGTGALCLEALSRGAASVVMVEQAAPVAQRLRQNLARLHAGGAEVIQADALEFLGRPPRPFDIIFLDPPFASDLIGSCAELIEARGWLRRGGFVYIEAPAARPPPLPPGWTLWRSKRAGRVGYHLARTGPVPATGADDDG
jgi:16S rRNA (guanine966-N2)-methyltransferase